MPNRSVPPPPPPSAWFGSVPGMRAATEVHSELVTGSARCGCPFDRNRTVRSTSAARTGSPDRVGASIGGATKPMPGMPIFAARRPLVRRQSHRDRGRPADRLQPVEHGVVGVQRLRQFRAGQPHIGGADEDAARGGVDDRDLDGPDARDLQPVGDVARRQQPSGDRAAGRQEVQPDRRARSRHAGDRLIPVHRRSAVHATQTSTRMIFLVFVLKMRTTAVSPFGRTIPSSTANGPTAEDMLPQFPW